MGDTESTSGTRFRENLDMAIFPLPLIQKEHWPAIGEIMHTKYRLTASGILAPRISVDRITDRSDMTSEICLLWTY